MKEIWLYLQAYSDQLLDQEDFVNIRNYDQDSADAAFALRAIMAYDDVDGSGKTHLYTYFFIYIYYLKLLYSK